VAGDEDCRRARCLLDAYLVEPKIIRCKLKEMKQAEPTVALEIRKTPGVCGGRACVGRTRIPVWLLIAFLKDGLSEESLLQSYPQLSPDHLRLVRDYYRQQRHEIDRDIQEEEEDEDEETLRDG